MPSYNKTNKVIEEEDYDDDDAAQRVNDFLGQFLSEAYAWITG